MNTFEQVSNDGNQMSVAEGGRKGVICPMSGGGVPCPMSREGPGLGNSHVDRMTDRHD